MVKGRKKTSVRKAKVTVKPKAKVVGVKKTSVTKKVSVKKSAKPLKLANKIQTGTGWQRKMAKKMKSCTF